jgi:hypothetical protein
MKNDATSRDAVKGSFRQFIASDKGRLTLLFLIVLLSRIPFLNAGYGAHVDAWRVANTARHIAETHDYEVSRFPGYPVQEIVCAFLWKGGPIALNGASAFFSAVAALLFALITREMKCRSYFTLGLVLAFAPVFYVNSVTSKDYIWALAFTLGSFYAILRGKPVAAGICLGLAIGSRLTSGVAALPLSLILQGLMRNDRPARKIALFAAASTVTALIVFLPVFIKYGTGFFDFYDQQYPDWRTIIHRSTAEVWGTFAIFGFLIVLGGMIVRTRTKPPLPPMFTCARFHVFAWVCAIVIYIAVFLRLPHHAAYLIPMMPFTLLLLARFSPRPAFMAFAVLVIASSFFSFDPASGFSLGDIFKDRQERLNITASIRGFLAFTEQWPGKNVFVVGGWEPEIANISPAAEHPGNSYVYLLNAQDLADRIKSGATIYYASPVIRAFNYRVYGVDLATYGAKDARAIYDQEAVSHPAPTLK